MRYVPFTRRDLAKAWLHYDSGKNLDQVAKIIGFHKRRFHPWLKKLGITKKRKPPYRHKTRTINQVLAFYEQGMPVLAIAEHLNIPNPSVQKILIRCKGKPVNTSALLTTRRRYSIFDEDGAKLVLRRYCMDRLPQRVIAERLSVTRICISCFIVRQRKRVRMQLEQGKDLALIASELGLPCEAVQVLISKQHHYIRTDDASQLTA